MVPKFNEKLFSLEEKVAIITGGSKGLGLAIAKGLASAGAICVIADIDQDNGREAERFCASCSPGSLFLKSDVTVEKDVEELMSKTFSNFGRIDILVNNVGIMIRKDILSTTSEDWNKIMGINLKSHFLCAKYVIPYMIKRNSGVIIEMGSVSSFLAHPRHTAYATSKGAIRMLIKAMAQDLGAYGIRVNGIAPGFIKTSMNENFLHDKANFQSIVRRIPIGRLGLPEDLVGPVIFLASQASEYITGTLLPIDGGRLID